MTATGVISDSITDANIEKNNETCDIPILFIIFVTVFQERDRKAKITSYD